jgi:hypothetical protein
LKYQLTNKTFAAMGQYFKPCIIQEDKTTVEAWVYAHDMNNGLKLMEHSWIPNNFVRAFESLILNNPKRVVWAGDYADPVMEETVNTFDLCEDLNKVKPKQKVKLSESRYIVNHTKLEYVDKQAVGNNDGWRIHPLPLLTCEGNGRGGGDYEGGHGEEYVGTWARDVISVQGNKPDGYTQIKPNFYSI